MTGWIFTAHSIEQAYQVYPLLIRWSWWTIQNRSVMNDGRIRTGCSETVLMSHEELWAPLNASQRKHSIISANFPANHWYLISAAMKNNGICVTHQTSIAHIHTHSRRNVVCFVSGSRGQTPLSGTVLMHSTPIEADSCPSLFNSGSIHAPGKGGLEHQKKGALTPVEWSCQSLKGVDQLPVMSGVSSRGCTYITPWLGSYKVPWRRR